MQHRKKEDGSSQDLGKTTKIKLKFFQVFNSTRWNGSTATTKQCSKRLDLFVFVDTKLENYFPVGWTVTRSSLEREVWGSNLGPFKSVTELPTAHLRCDIFKGVVLPAGAMRLRWAPQIRYTLRHSTASTIKDLI